MGFLLSRPGFFLSKAAPQKFLEGLQRVDLVKDFWLQSSEANEPDVVQHNIRLATLL